MYSHHYVCFSPVVPDLHDGAGEAEDGAGGRASHPTEAEVRRNRDRATVQGRGGEKEEEEGEEEKGTVCYVGVVLDRWMWGWGELVRSVNVKVVVWVLFGQVMGGGYLVSTGPRG